MTFSFINLSTITFSHPVIIMLANTGPSDLPIVTPSICLYNLLLKDNAVFWQVSRINFLNERLDNDVLISFSLYTRLRIMLTVLRKGIFVKKRPHLVKQTCNLDFLGLMEAFG